MFNCEYCNYETTVKSNYKLHLKTKKHLLKKEISPSIVHH